MAGLHWLEMDPSVLGKPFYVMDKVEGVVPVQWTGKDTSIFPNDDIRHRIGIEFVEVLSKIHSIDYQRAGLEFLGAPPTPDEAAAREIDRWETFYEDALLLEVPLLRETIGWLRHNMAASGRLGLCHGDYRIGNFMLNDHRIVAMFDWELAHISDPVEDIAWSGLPLFRGRSPLFSHLLAQDEFFSHYAALTGLHVDPEVFYFWTVLGHLKAAAVHLQACRAFEEGKAKDLRLAAMGHQTLYILRHLSETLGRKRFSK
jgi:aminoglycoside phosphotransferase (APT) family kinase protein